MEIILEEKDVLVLWKVCSFYQHVIESKKEPINALPYEMEGDEEKRILDRNHSILFHAACIINLHGLEKASEHADKILEKDVK